ncbi:MAG: A/G-specific adenine glycosylase [Oligosphaeraceae bacterium]
MISSRHITPLLAWFAENARPLPWRETPPDPYHVWLSEIMLQQTRIEAVTEAYRRILETCPTVEALAALSEEALLKLWQGLGYYSRARHLHEAARQIVAAGGFPGSWEGWRSLPGVGDYTASAVGAIVLGERHPAVDGNVVRVLSRLLAREVSPLQARTLLGKGLEETASPSAFTQAWMELGEVVCIPHGRPRCGQCPLAALCRAHQKGEEETYPPPRRRPARPRHSLTVFRILREDGGLALRRRPARGLLAGMWEPPHVPGSLGVPAVWKALAAWGISREDAELRPLPVATHLFTHQEWSMTNYQVRLAQVPPEFPFAWATPRELATRFPVPSAFRLILP